MFREFLWTWIPWIFNKCMILYSKCQFTYKVIYNGLMVKKEWIFIKNCEIPVQSEAFGSIHDDMIQWRCSVCPAAFTQPGTLDKDKHLSYLGFTVKIQDVYIDLSDWVNEVRWSGSREPTVKEIFLLWSCESGECYLHCLDDIEVEIINNMGDTIKKGLNA